MYVTGESTFISAKSGLKKDKTEWFLLRFLDSDADCYFNVFVEQDIFNKFKNVAKHTPVIITAEIIPGTRRFNLQLLELVK